MKLPKLLKNINRGIALLVILSIGLAIYVLYDNNRFKKEQPVIGKLLTEFTEQTADMMLLPQEYRVYKKKLPQEILMKKAEENNKIIDKYWTTETQKNIWFTRDHEKRNAEYISGFS